MYMKKDDSLEYLIDFQFSMTTTATKISIKNQQWACVFAWCSLNTCKGIQHPYLLSKVQNHHEIHLTLIRIAIAKAQQKVRKYRDGV